MTETTGLRTVLPAACVIASEYGTGARRPGGSGQRRVARRRLHRHDDNTEASTHASVRWQASPGAHAAKRDEGTHAIATNRSAHAATAWTQGRTDQTSSAILRA